jgi:hypothetical protein
VNLSLAYARGARQPDVQSLVASARLLAQRLSEYSESTMAAGWLDDLEYMVWQDLVDRRIEEDLLVSPKDSVLPPLDEAEKVEFRQLSKAIDGWVVHDSQDVEDRAAYVPMADWVKRFDDWLGRARKAVQPDSG